MALIVNDYTRRELTFDTDMLPALAAIATRFANVLNDTYCAGLWRNDLRQSLIWKVGIYPENISPSKHREPTWS